MRILYYDCFCGISGDMNLGALLDLGVPEEHLRKGLAALKLPSEYELSIGKGVKKGITGTKVEVLFGHEHLKKPEHHHRNLADIERIIQQSDLNDRVKELSLKMFFKVAEAEAKVHGSSLYEVGAIDSIIDMVGAAIALDYLDVDHIKASPVQVGGGFVNCAHGVLPVPAPATLEILKNIPMKSGLVPFETTTPTGAAILAANVDEFTAQMNFTLERIGYGLGSRDLEIPNVLRVFLGQSADDGKSRTREEVAEQYVMETNIDDMNPEFYDYIEERLLAQGALDVYKTPIIMKKGRPAVKLSVLFNREQEEALLKVIFEETTSIGIRKYPVDKIMLDRDFFKIETRYGTVTLKRSYYRGKLIKQKPEYEECRKIAQEQEIALEQVYEEVKQAILRGAQNTKEKI